MPTSKHTSAEASIQQHASTTTPPAMIAGATITNAAAAQASPDARPQLQTQPPPSQQAPSAVLQYLKQLSGQEKETSVIELDHAYNKPWNHHPDERLRTRPARYLFMKDFPRHLKRRADRHLRPEDIDIDVQAVARSDELEDADKNNPFMIEVNQLGLKTSPIGQDVLSDSICNFNHDDEKMCPNKQGWTKQQHQLWDEALHILESDRLSRLSQAGRSNELIFRKNLQDKTCNRFRYMFANHAQWEPSVLTWLHQTLVENLSHAYLMTYAETMHLLRQRLPTLIDRFFITVKATKQSVGLKVNRQQLQPDPIQVILNNQKPKRITGSPLFMIVPNGPLIAHQFTSQRMKHWHAIFGALGKVITVNTTNNDPSLRAVECLKQIRMAVREKVIECKEVFSENRPLVLVGFSHSSLIATSCALENAGNVSATICLGFPLTGLNGFRGDLDDPLLDTSVPTLFVIGQNSTMCTLDDMEDFRERISKTETGLVVVGGANDRLVVSSSKKRHYGLTQAMVDRAIADEIYDFVRNL